MSGDIHETTPSGKEHWHRLRVTETIAEAVVKLRGAGLYVEYDLDADGPADRVAFIGDRERNDSISNCAAWREAAQQEGGGAKLLLVDVPENAMASIELHYSRQSFPAFTELIAKIDDALTIVGERCSLCAQQVV